MIRIEGEPGQADGLHVREKSRRHIRMGANRMKDQERDVLRKTILELVKKGHVHYTDIEKRAVATCLRLATSNTIRKQFYHYLLPNGYVERVSRGIHRITQKGEKLLEILN